MIEAKYSLIHLIKGITGGIYLGIRVWLGLVVREGEDLHYPPCSPQCPDTKQEYVLSEGYNVDHNSFKDYGTFSGRVKDREGHCIEDHQPAAHVFTNEEGEFLVCLPAGHYWVKAVR